MANFTTAEIQAGDATIIVRSCGTGSPILLLHGFPQTHLMWRNVAPLLAREFTVVCADLRGYGRSSCLPSAPDHAPYAKRAMAQDMVTVMERLGFPRFSVAGHDRGGRVAHRMAFDHPGCVDRLTVLDIVPSETAWESRRKIRVSDSSAPRMQIGPKGGPMEIELLKTPNVSAWEPCQ